MAIVNLRSVLLFWLILLYIGDHNRSLCLTPSLSISLYVVPFPSLFSNMTDGSMAYPYLSVQDALDHIERNYYRNATITYKTTIYLYPTYHFVSTIQLSHVHSHTRLTTMNASDIHFYKNFVALDHTPLQLQKASISGGIPVTDWTALGNNTYKVNINQSIFVNQLFVNNQRIVRTRVPMNHSDYLHYAAPLNDSTLARYGFQYAPGQFDYKSLTDAMVIVYFSWGESHHYIDRIIPANNTVFFSNPSNRPIGVFPMQSQQRFSY